MRDVVVVVVTSCASIVRAYKRTNKFECIADGMNVNFFRVIFLDFIEAICYYKDIRYKYIYS